MRRLSVSPNHRFLVHDDGTPFFYLADTAWELYHRLTRDELDLYLRDRADKGFTAIQAVALAEHGFTVPTPEGHLALHDLDPTKPDEGYFATVDWAVARAAALGLVTVLLPTWGDKVNQAWGAGPEIFTPENARIYGEWLGRRYRDQPALIWCLGGDRAIDNETHLAIWRAMAEGLTAGDGGAHLRTFHPPGGRGSAEMVHQEGWLDFNLRQSGHGSADVDNAAQIARDYACQPPKPCVDGEPCYEDHPIGFKPETGWFDEHHVRRAAWRAVLAGAAGHTYGCHDIWQFFDGVRQPISWARTPWREAIRLPGAGQMGHLRRLIEARPYLDLVPDPALLAWDSAQGDDSAVAARDSHGRYALVYLPLGQPAEVDLTHLAGPAATTWYDPRTGVGHADGRVTGDTARLVPPTNGRGQDWVLVLDTTG